MEILKEDIKIESISELLKKSKSDDGTFLDALYNLYLFIGLTKGIDDIRNGRGTPLKDIKTEMEALYERTSRKFG